MQLDGVRPRLWPTDTAAWFPVHHSEAAVRHNFHELDRPEKLAACQAHMARYLRGLLTFDPPAHWFGDQEFHHFFEELKHLVGETSAAQGGGGRNLTLGTTLLVLAAAEGTGAQRWIDSIQWSRRSDEILPKQTQEQAKEAILSLAGLFAGLTLHRETGLPLVRRVTLAEGRLQVWLDFDCERRVNGQPSLLEKVTYIAETRGKEYGGSVYTAYRKFFIASAKTKEGWREARCVINVKPVDPVEVGDKGEARVTLMEIVACR